MKLLTRLPVVLSEVVLFSFLCMSAQRISVIPLPMKVVSHSGQFTLTDSITILAKNDSAGLQLVAGQLAERLQLVTGFPVRVESSLSGRNLEHAIILEIDARKENLGDEGYLLEVTKQRVVISAPRPAGVFYGVQSLYQLLPPEVEGSHAVPDLKWEIPCVTIEDKPRFQWRGMHLDVGRHFFPKESIKKYLDILAMYKFNTFHWHLTEDQGWRIEIKKYPRLTEIGSQRRETAGDCIPYGGFYTQEDIREVVAYAAERFITIVPEIELPGHSTAALAAYPEFSCTGGPFKVGTDWGVFNDVYCVGEEGTFLFLEDVLTEVVDMFPGNVIHIGGDEVPKLRWKNCVKCQERIKSEKLKDENELQSYFIRRIEKFLNAKGRRMIGWDEILEGGLAPNALVMSWRGMEGGIAAAKAGHDAVMTPGQYCYFNHYQGIRGEPAAIGAYLPIDTVYSYEPVPAELLPAQAKHILGVQGNMWTENIPDERYLEYMLLPRLCALSEVAWSDKRARKFSDFMQRLEYHYDRFAAKDVNFRVPPPIGFGGRSFVFGDTTVTLIAPGTTAKAYFSFDAQDSVKLPHEYVGPLPVKGSETLKAQTILRNGKMSAITTASFIRVDRALNGISYEYYEGSWEFLPDFKRLKPVRSGQAYDINLDQVPHRAENFTILFEGFFNIDKSGAYTFYVTSDDGSKLFIDDGLVVLNDGLHVKNEASGRIGLSRGKHRIEVQYFQRGGAAYLDVSAEGPHFPRQSLPPSWLVYDGK